MTTENQLQDDEINLLEYWNVLWKRKWFLIGLFIVTVVATMLISLLMPKFYKSETVIISTTSEAGGLGAALSSLPLAGMLGGAAGIQTSADKLMVILKSRSIAEAVIHRFDLLKVFYDKEWDASKNTWKNESKHPLLADAVKELTSSVVKFTKSKEGAITISVEWKDPKLAADIANYYVFSLTEFMKDKSMNITIQVVDRAIPAERKSRPIISLNMTLAGITSLFLGVFAVFVQEYIGNQKTRRV